MAEVKSSVIGGLSGRIENFVYRNRNGKIIAYARPIDQKVNKSVKAVRARSNFASTIALAKSVNSVPRLKEIWRNASVPGINSFQKLIKNNSKLVREGLLTTSNKITPEGLPLKLNLASIEDNKLKISFDFTENPDLSFPASLFIYFYFVNTGTIIPLFREISEPEPGGTYNQETALDLHIIKLVSEDPAPIMFIALAGGTSYKDKVYWTSTASLRI